MNKHQSPPPNKEMKITLVNLFRYVSEGELYYPSIVSYGRAEWEKQFADDTVDEMVLSYKHFLFINLWLVHLKFEWIQKV